MDSVKVLERPKAAEYGEMIADQIVAIGEIVDEYGSQITSQDLRDMADSFTDDDDCESAAVCVVHADLLDDLGIGGNDCDDLWQSWVTVQLCVDLTGSRPIDDSHAWGIDRVTVTVTYGGPSCYVWTDHGSGVVVECYWGSDHWERRYPDLCDLGSALWEMAEYE